MLLACFARALELINKELLLRPLLCAKFCARCLRRVTRKGPPSRSHSLVEDGVGTGAVFGVGTVLREPGRIGSILGTPVPARRGWHLSRVLQDRQVARTQGAEDRVCVCARVRRQERLPPPSRF